MIDLDKGWVSKGHLIFHVCGPGFLVPLLKGQSSCDCGIPITARAQRFAKYIELVDMILGDNELE